MPKLSRREAEVAGLVAQRLTNREIAERLFVSERTAEYHVEQIRNKLGFHSRDDIAEWVAAQAAAEPREPPPNRLPAQLTRFVGRAHDLEAISRLLGRTRLVTITGAGGTGKTRLAVEAARRSLPAHAGGAWFVDLQAIEDPRLVPTEVAAALQVEDLARGLANAERLVVLDNCEQVAESCRDLLEELLPACPGLVVLATSREPLHVAGEAVWTLRPLPAADAQSLFTDRASMAAPEISIGAPEREIVAAICDDLDGIPLAIELAASRARLMSLVDIEERLKGRLQVLADSGARSRRHRSLAAAVDWSYELLTEPERSLFRKLGIFAGGFLLDSAEAVAGFGVAEILDRLVERSMVVAEIEPDRPTRYRLLVPMREFARERLAGEGLTAEMRALHFRRYFELAEIAGKELQGPRQAYWLRRIEDELDEYRAAGEWALENDPESAVAIAGDLTWFWGLRGRVIEGRRLLAQSLERGQVESPSRAQALIGSGWLARLQGDVELGARFHAQSVEILSRFDDPVALGTAMVWNAEAASSRGDWEAARRGWEDAIELLAPLGTSEPLAYAHLELALVYTRDHRIVESRQFATASLAMMKELGNARAAGLGHIVLGHAALLERDFDEAQREVLEAAAGLEAAGARADLIWSLGLGSAILVERGELAAGVVMAGAEAALREATGRTSQVDTITEAFPSRVEKARAQLGEDAYQAAWERGLGLDPDEALALLRDPASATDRPPRGLR